MFFLFFYVCTWRNKIQKWFCILLAQMKPFPQEQHIHLMILHQFTERAESDLVSQQHVAVLWSIDQQVLGSLAGSVGKHISKDPLADTHQEEPVLALVQQRLGLFTGYYTCRGHHIMCMTEIQQQSHTQCMNADFAGRFWKHNRLQITSYPV